VGKANSVKLEKFILNAKERARKRTRRFGIKLSSKTRLVKLEEGTG